MTPIKMFEQQEKSRGYRTPQRPQYRRVRRQPSKSFRFVVLFLVLAIGVFIYMNKDNISFFNHKKEVSQSAFNFNFNLMPSRQNILLMGIDSAANPSQTNAFKGNRSDTMLLISVAPYGKNVNVISIPRDSKVFIKGRENTDKINHAFAFGGAKLAKETVEDTFGVKINHYLAISNDGVIKLIDTLGGLPIYIEKDMKYDDFTAKLHINLKQGNHILTGKETEGYLRFRHDSFGDIGRIRRQQWFFNALMSKLKDPSTITKLPEILSIMPEYIQTDMSMGDLAKFAGLAKNLDSSSIQVATIPGAPSTKGVISYWIIDPDKTQELMDKMIYRHKSDLALEDLSIGVLYSPSKAQDAINLKTELEEHGIKEIKMQENNNLSKNCIAIYNLDVTGDMMSELKKEIPSIKDEHTIYDPIGINRTGKDLTIVLAK